MKICKAYYIRLRVKLYPMYLILPISVPEIAPAIGLSHRRCGVLAKGKEPAYRSKE